MPEENEDMSIETKLELVSVELDSIAADLQTIEDSFNALLEKYGRKS